MPVYKGDTLLHIAARYYMSTGIDKVSELIDRTILAPVENSVVFFTARNSQGIQFQDIPDNNKYCLRSLIIGSLYRSFYGFFHQLFFDLTFPKFQLFNFKKVALFINGLSRLPDFLHSFVFEIYNNVHHNNQLKINLYKIIQLFNEQIKNNTIYAEVSKKFLDLKNKEGISFLDYVDAQERLHSSSLTSPQDFEWDPKALEGLDFSELEVKIEREVGRQPIKTPLSSKEHLLITKFTEKAREYFHNNEDSKKRENEFTRLFEKALEKRNKIENSYKVKFVKKLNNSIKKLY